MSPELVIAATVLLTAVAATLSVGLHYEGLNWLARRLARKPGNHRRRVLYAVVGVLLLHIVEIWIFAAGYWLCLRVPDGGDVFGAPHGTMLDMVYLSAMTFSTVGFGDVAPEGAIRLMSGTEAVLGLFLIAWSATFTYFEMERNWRDR